LEVDALGGVNPRCATKSIDLQPGIVCDDKAGYALRNCHSFENRVSFKSLSSLRNVRNLRMVSQIVHMELRPEDLPDLCRLIRIARCEQKLDHS